MGTKFAILAILWFFGSVIAKNTCETEQQLMNENENLKEKVSLIESQNANLQQLSKIMNCKLKLPDFVFSL